MINMDFFKCKNHLIKDDLIFNYSISQTELKNTKNALYKAKKQITELDFKIYKQKKEIKNLHKKIKDLKNERN